MQKLLFIVLTLVLTTVCYAQTKNGNAEVLKMLAARLPENTILLYIEKSDAQFDGSADALVALSKAGATPRILDGVVNKAATIAHPRQQTTENAHKTKEEASKNEYDPFSEGEVYLVDRNKRTMLKSASFNSNFNLNKATLLPGVGLFKKSAVKLKFVGPTALIRTANRMPFFEIVLPKSKGTQGLVYILRADKKSDRREIKAAQSSVMGGVKVGFTNDQIVQSEVKEIHSNSKQSTYRLSLTNALSPGEYAVALGGTLLFDFGVD